MNAFNTWQWSDLRLASCIIQEAGWWGLCPEARVNIVKLLHTLKRNGCPCYTELSSFHVTAVQFVLQVIWHTPQTWEYASETQDSGCVASIIVVVFYLFFLASLHFTYSWWAAAHLFIKLCWSFILANMLCQAFLKPPAKGRAATDKTGSSFTYIITAFSLN